MYVLLRGFDAKKASLGSNITRLHAILDKTDNGVINKDQPLSHLRDRFPYVTVVDITLNETTGFVEVAAVYETE
jgi:hypothetical protein